MSTQSHPKCGYAVKASDFIIGMIRVTESGNSYVEAFAEALRENTLREFVDEADHAYRDAFESAVGFAFPSSAYMPDSDNGDNPGDLEADEWYLIFEEDELYVLQPTKLMAGLQKAGVEPKLSAWSTFG